MLGICAGSQIRWLHYIARCACRCCCLRFDEAAKCVEMQSALQAHPEETIPGKAPVHTPAVEPEPQEVTPSPGIHGFFLEPPAVCLRMPRKPTEAQAAFRLSHVATLLISDVLPSSCLSSEAQRCGFHQHIRPLCPGEARPSQGSVMRVQSRWAI